MRSQEKSNWPKLTPMIKDAQKILGLFDWKIKGKWVTPEQAAEDLGLSDPDEEENEGYVLGLGSGGTSWEVQNKSATICVIKREEALDEKICRSTVNHEVLHLLMWPFAPSDEDPVKEILFEQVMHTLNKVLDRVTS